MPKAIYRLRKQSENTLLEGTFIADAEDISLLVKSQIKVSFMYQTSIFTPPDVTISELEVTLNYKDIVMINDNKQDVINFERMDLSCGFNPLRAVCRFKNKDNVMISDYVYLYLNLIKKGENNK